MTDKIVELLREQAERECESGVDIRGKPLRVENHFCTKAADRISKLESALEKYEADDVRYMQRISELEAENKTLHRMLAADPDRATSTGAAQAAMEYQVEIRDRRIRELEEEVDKLMDGAQFDDERIAELEEAERKRQEFWK